MPCIIRLVLLALATAWSVGLGSAQMAERTVLVYGDSLSAPYGIRQRDGWVALLQERIRQDKFNYTVTNASISGETSAGGASRIAKALEQARPQLVILALGSNDGLRGLPVAQMKANLAAIVGAAQARGARVMIVGNRMPPNYGAQYTESFANAFTELGREYKSTVVPFLLEPIAARRELFQPDNLHPTAEAQPAIMEGIWKALRPLLIRVSDPIERQTR